MANRLRFRSGQVQLHKLRVNSQTVIEAGDMVWLDTDDIKPASAFPWDTNLVTTQASFAALFVGIAHQPSAAGETAPVSVDVSPHAVYEFDVPGTTYEFGDLLGPAAQSSLLMNQQLEKVSAAGDAIARTVEYAATSKTQIRVSFASAYHVGSANANASLG